MRVVRHDGAGLAGGVQQTAVGRELQEILQLEVRGVLRLAQQPGREWRGEDVAAGAIDRVVVFL